MDSVLLQSFPPSQVIVVDDGSTDGSLEQCCAYQTRGVTVVTQRNRGPSAARNVGLLRASYDYLAFLDADDVWLPDHLEIAARAIENFPLAGLYSSGHLTKNAGKYFSARTDFQVGWSGKVDDFFLHYSRGLSLVNSSTAIVPKSVLRGLGGFPEDVRIGEDIITWVRIAESYDVVYTERKTAIYNLSATNGGDKRCLEDVPASILFISSMIAKDRKNGIQRDGLVALFESIVSSTVGGLLIDRERRVPMKIWRVAFANKFYRATCMILLMLATPPCLLKLVRKARKKQSNLPAYSVEKTFNYK